MAIEDNITITETGPDGTETDFEITTAKVDDLSGDDKTFAEEAVEALFDDGSADNEAAYMDYDGDGVLDTAGADTDGDGQIDTAVADTDGDGTIDAVGKDTDGDGQLDTVGVDSDGDGTIDAVGMDTDGDGNLDVAEFDTDGDGEADVFMADTDGDGEMEVVEADGEEQDDFTLEASEGLPTEEEISTNSIEFTVGEDGFPVSDTGDAETPAGYDETSFETPVEFEASPVVDTPAADPVTDTGYSSSTDDPSTATAEADAELAAQQAHTDAAKDAQSAADEFVAQGDYKAAADAREVAENEAWEAGDSSMLGASDQSDLENAAYKQDVADDYRAQQQEHIEEGDYAAAKEDAQNAGYATGDADYLASGSDHTGQSDNDAYNLDWAVHQDKNADYNAQNAEAYAAEGDFDNAERYADRAGEYQESADHFAAKADVESDFYQDDPTSDVMAGGSYDAGTYDAGTYDAGAYDAVDTGIDTTVDTTPVSYDTTTDDTL